MLIDAFSEGWKEELDQRARAVAPTCSVFVLVDGAFIPGLHKSLETERKALLFAALPGCSDMAKDASPFLAPYDMADKRLRALLQRCSRWPMLSVVETPEPIALLATRLAAWCVVEADSQRFNFRFPDTRRLPAIFRTLTAPQRAGFTGPMKRWSYMGRNGRWNELPIAGDHGDGAADPVLDARQFASLVDDSKADELMLALRDLGHDVFGSPSRSHALLTIALRAALAVGLDDDGVLGWCEWFWRHDKLYDDAEALSALQGWQQKSA